MNAKRNQIFATLSLACAIALTGCAKDKKTDPVSPALNAPANDRSEAALTRVMEVFLSLGTKTFISVRENKADLSHYGEFFKINEKGDWFKGTRHPDMVDLKSAQSEINLFKTPLKFKGLTIIGTGFTSFKGDEQHFGDSIYAGFYFAESPEVVHEKLKGYFATKLMVLVGETYANMWHVIPNDPTTDEMGWLLDKESKIPGAKSYFNFSLQKKPSKKK